MAGTSPTKVWFPAINTPTVLPAFAFGLTVRMLMITLSADFCNPVSQDFYNNLLASIQFHRLSCTCGHSSCLKIHGNYTRGIKCGTQTNRLCICRVKCSICGRTHALLPSFLVPYSQISLPDQTEIILAAESGESPHAVMERSPSIDENNVSSILLRYRRFWRQRLLSESIPLMPSPLLVRRCFEAFHRQFLQIRSTPNLLFLKTT
jgi:Domain of unknown function (DUF6431)